MIQVVAGVMMRDGQYLICQRRKDDTHGLKWEFPGGKIEPGENAEFALRRELQEELEIDATIGRQLFRQVFTNPNQQTFEILFFVIDSWVGECVPVTFEQICWCAPEQLTDYDFLEADLVFIRQLSAEARA